MKMLLHAHLHELNKNHQQLAIDQNQIKYGYPVNFQKCKNHRRANMICKTIADKIHFEKQKQICQCCGRIVGNQPYKALCYDNNIFAKYGPGIPLYFKFFQYVCYLLFMYLFVFGVYGTVSNFMSNDCQKYKKCWSDTFGMKLSFLNSYENDRIPMIQLMLIILVIILQTYALLFIRHTLRQKKQQFDDFITSPSDFSIILRRLPANTAKQDIQAMVQQFRMSLSVEQKAQTNNLKIHKIIFAYDLSQFLQIQKDNIQNFKESYDKKIPFHKIPQPLIQKKLTTAIVIFQKQKSKSFFIGYLSCLEQLKRSQWLGHQPLSTAVQINGQYVNVERAPEPDDIIWQNQGISIKELLIRRIGVFSFSIGMLVISAILQYALARWRMTFGVQNQMVQRLFSIGLATFITIVNYLITLLLIFSCHFQKSRTHTLLKISLTFKLVLMQFINSGLISIVITATIYLPNFRFYKTVICNDMLFIMIMNVVVNNVINFIMVIFQIPNWLDRILLHLRKDKYTQHQANKIFEAMGVDIEYKYAYIFKTLWLTAFFMPSQPSVIILSILALVINYWSQKYLFSGYYSIPQMFSGRISISVLDLLNYTSLWLILGSFFIHLLRMNFHIRLMPIQYLIPHIIGFIISLFVIYAPLSNISKKIFGEYVTQNQSYKSYQIEQQNFEVTYEGSNPAYKKDRPFRGKFADIGEKLAQAFGMNEGIYI